MNQKAVNAFFVIAACATFFYVINNFHRTANVLFVNGTVYTLDAKNSVGQAVAVRGDRILAVGSTVELSRQYTADTVIDLQGKTIMPGFIDAHAHMNGLGELLRSIVLVSVPSADDVVNLVKEKISRARPGEWIYGRGWDQNLWEVKEFPTASLLDKVSPENPVVLIRIDGHVSWVNSKAMAIAGVTSAMKDPDGGKIMRDARGNPTGIFMDNARNLVENFIPPFTEEEIEQNILRAAEECAKAGLTEVGDMGMDSIHIEVYKRLADQQKLPIRIYCAISDTSSAWKEWSKREPLIGYGNGMLTVRAVKIYMDGALGSRGAALVEDYSDDPGNRGITQRSDEELEATIRLAFDKGYQPCIHAIGDRANHIILNAYENILKSVPKKDYRPRIEHVQVLLPEDIARFKQLGVLPSMQPAHCVSDMFWAEARLGPERVKSAYAWKSLLNTGTSIIGGSDFPNDVMYPLWGFYAAITRSDASGYPQDGWHREQKMTREEAARCFTQWAAYGAFQENAKGTIEPGKLADLTILSNDIMQIPPKDILATEVEMTVIGGKVVYQKPANPKPQN